MLTHTMFCFTSRDSFVPQKTTLLVWPTKTCLRVAYERTSSYDTWEHVALCHKKTHRRGVQEPCLSAPPWDSFSCASRIHAFWFHKETCIPVPQEDISFRATRKPLNWYHVFWDPWYNCFTALGIWGRRGTALTQPTRHLVISVARQTSISH